MSGTKPFTSKDVIPEGSYSKVFLIFSIIEAIVVIVVISISLNYDVQNNKNTDSYLSIIILVSLLFYLYFAFHGIYTYNKFEIFALFFSLLLIELYTIYRFVTQEDDLIQYISLIIISFTSLVICFVSIKLFKGFEEWRFKQLVPILQNDVELRGLYNWYQAWEAILKLDINFGIIFVLIGLFFFFSIAQTIINMIVILFAFVWAFVGQLGIRLEDRKIMFLFYLFSFIFPADIIFDLYTLDTTSNTPSVQIIFAGVVALIIRVTVILVTIKCQSNFGKSLRDKVFDPEEEEEPIISQIANKDIRPYLTLTIKRIRGLVIEEKDENEMDEKPKY